LDLEEIFVCEVLMCKSVTVRIWCL